MSYPLVRELAAEKIPVRLTCGVLGFGATRRLRPTTRGSQIRSAHVISRTPT